MKRILVFAEPSTSHVVPDALSRRVRSGGIDAFVVMLWLPRRAVRRTAPTRFWQRAHARLDELLHELDDPRILADGIVAGGHAGTAVSAWLRLLRPRTILVSCDGAPRRWIECVEATLDDHSRQAARRPSITWLVFSNERRP